MPGDEYPKHIQTHSAPPIPDAPLGKPVLDKFGWVTYECEYPQRKPDGEIDKVDDPESWVYGEGAD